MDLIRDLLAIGFTEYEARVYLALLRSSPSTGYQISKEAGVPRSMVYEALGRLNARGAVLKTEEARGTLYRPLPPRVLLDRYDEEHRRILSGLSSGLEQLYAAEDEGYIWSINGRESVLSYANRMLETAEKEVLLVLPDAAIEALQERIGAAETRGVAISILLTGGGSLNAGRVVRHARLESELQELENFLLLVADNREALIGQESSTTITRNRNMVLIARQFVWMELFTQRIFERLSDELLSQIDPVDRQFFKHMADLEPRRKSGRKSG